MTLETNEIQQFTSLKLLQLIIRWYKPLLIVVLISILTSWLFSCSWFIKPKYMSTVVMFPTSTNSVSKVLLSELNADKNDILEFGEAEQAEQLLQILNSHEIRSKIIEKYNLMEHYQVDPESKYKMTKLYKKFEDNIHFGRTQYMAVEIEVLDTDPQKAADIANDIASLLDSTKNKIQRERAIKGFKIVEAQFLSLKGEIKAMEDSLTQLRKIGINDYETQAQVLNEQLAIAISKNSAGAIHSLENKIKILSQYGGAYVSIRDALEHEKKQFSLIKAKYEEAKVDATQELPCKFVVNKAYKAEKKTYPIQWLIVLVTTISCVILAIMVIILIENHKIILDKILNKK